MDQIIPYFIEFAFFQCCFFLAYYLILKHQDDYRFSRFFLISSPIIALGIPLLPTLSIGNLEVFSILLETVQIGGAAEPTIANKVNSSSSTSIFLIAYVAVSLLFMSRIVIGLAKLFKIKLEGNKYFHEGVRMVTSEDIKSPFSFMSYIYMPTKYAPGTPEFDLIFKHEILHVEQHHSIEKLFLSILKSVFWWNPINYFYCKELELAQEFEVDQILTERVSKKQYANFLLNQFTASKSLLLANTISSQLKERIMKLKTKSKSLPNIQKWGLFVSASLLMILLHACQSEQLETPRSYTVIDEDESKTAMASFTEEVIDTLMIFNTETLTEEIRYVKSERTIYKSPDVMPTFPGCTEIIDAKEKKECSNQKLLEYIYKNLEYPEEARKAGIEGMAIAKFVIDDKGHVKKEKIVRSVGFGIDEEVHRIFQKMRDDEIYWDPGTVDSKPVFVEFTLPVKFKLEG